MAATPPSAPEPSRRAAIVSAATELFARQGYHGVGMRAIADAVGIRSSSLYHHFPSKVDLLKVISLDATRAFAEAHVPILEGDGPAADRLRSVLRAHVLYFHEHRSEQAVGLAHLRELSALEPQSYEVVQEVRRGYQHAVQTAIEQGIAAKEFVVSDAFIASLEVLGLINSIGNWFHEGGPRTIEQVADEYVSVAVDRILGARPARTADGRPPAPQKRSAAKPAKG